MTGDLEQGIVRRLGEILGVRLLEFALNGVFASLLEGQLTDAQAACVHQLEKIVTRLREQIPEGAPVEDAVRYLVMNPFPENGPLAISMHLVCGGSAVAPPTGNDLESIIVQLARNLYPVLLLPVDDTRIPTEMLATARAMQALHLDPLGEQFQAAVLADSVLAQVFVQADQDGGPWAMLYRSSSDIGSVQLSSLARLVLCGVWRDRSSDEPLRLDDFIRLALERLRFVRNALGGAVQPLRARVVLAGVVLPDGGPIDFGGLVLREMSPYERSAAPAHTTEQLHGVDAEGGQVVINYEGDIVADFVYSYFVQVEESPHDGPIAQLPQEIFAARKQVEEAVVRLRLALLLAVQREQRVHIVPTLRAFDDPLGDGFTSWADSRRAANLWPARLTVEEVAAWRHWHGLLTGHPTDKLTLATSRVVRATSERHDPVDVLVDSVIAWESLFGSKEGEPTLRVTASLALLLEGDYNERRKLRTELAKIYALRSDVVHGTASPVGDDIALCHRALDIAIRALRAILAHRPDLLEEPDSNARSLRLILGSSDPSSE